MNLLAPAALAFAAVAVPIIAMYFLKMRRPPRTVPSTFLWEQALRDVQANAPWQRLRPNLLLLLQLLAVIALAVALARPAVMRAALAQGDVVVVLDSSERMSATDLAPSRFGVAKQRIAALIDDLGPNDVMSIVLMSRHPQVLIAQSGDHGALHAALDRAATGDEEPDPDAALSVATALSRGGRHASLFVYTAAGDPAIVAPPGSPAELHVTTIGGRLRDLGIVALAASRAADGTITVLTRVDNLGQLRSAADVQLDIARGQAGNLAWHNLADLHPVSLSPGAEQLIYRTRLPADTVAVRAHLIGGDDIAADDWAWATVATPATRHVLLVTPGNTFLSLALSLNQHVSLDTITPDAYTAKRARNADLVVFDQTPLPATLPAAALLVVGPQAGTLLPFGITVQRPTPGSGVQVGDDPLGLLNYTNPGQVALGQATPLTVPSWAYAVARTRGQPVLVAGQTGPRRVAVLGFPLYDSDWPAQPGFPILVQNLLDWLAPPLTAPDGIVRPGDSVNLVAAPSAASLTVTNPDGQVTQVAPPLPAQPFVQTSLPGLYMVEQDSANGIQRAVFAVSTFPVPGIQEGHVSTLTFGSSVPRVGKAEVPVELAPLVAALALLVLGSEWWVAVRRR